MIREVKNQNSKLEYTICDGQFCVSTWLGYSTQLFNQTVDVTVKAFCRHD